MFICMCIASSDLLPGNFFRLLDHTPVGAQVYFWLCAPGGAQGIICGVGNQT